MRLLGAVRLSRDTDETTSPARQRAAIESWSAAGGHTITHIAEDIDVSGAVAPADRPELGQWLKRPDEWDAIIVHKPDRLSRSLRDFLNLWHDLDKQGKTLVSVDPALDFATPIGRMTAGILMSFSQFEREVISGRVKDAHRHIKQGSGYPGGQVPFGYMPIKRDGKGWEYAHDPEFAPVVREVAGRAINGESMRQIALWLNSSGVPTSRDAVRRRSGKPELGSKWSTEAVRSLFRAPAIAGMQASDGRPLRDADGMIVERCEGIITRDEWEQLKTAITGSAHKAHRVDANPLLRVAYCALDGAPMYSTGDKSKNHRYRYYRCSLAAKDECSGRNIPADWLEKETGLTFLDQVGDIDMFDRIPVPAEDHTRELAEAEEAIANLDSEYQAGQLHARAYARMVSALEDKREALSALPSRPAGYRLRPTGQTFAQRWEQSDAQERRRLMLSAGFEVRVSRTAEGFTFGSRFDPELAQRAQRAAAGEVIEPDHEAWQAAWDAGWADGDRVITASSVPELLEKLKGRPDATAARLGPHR
jgi:site-specific DNA recombinase